MGEVATRLSPEMAAKCSAYAISYLDPHQPVLFVSALKSLENFVQLSQSSSITQIQGSILQSIEIVLKTSEIETISFLLQIALVAIHANPINAASYIPTLLPTLLQTWQNALCDSLACGLLVEVMISLSQSQVGLTHLLDTSSDQTMACSPNNVLAVISNIITNHAETGASASAIEIVSGLLRSCHRIQTPQIGNQIVRIMFPVIMTHIMTTDEAEVLQNGQECLKRMIQYHLIELMQIPNGLTQIIQFIAKMLHPDQSESRALYIGDVVRMLIRKASEYLTPVLGDLLLAVVHRLASAKTITFIQQMILIFLSLLHSDRFEETIQFLTSTPIDSPIGSSALSIVMGKWMEVHDSFNSAIDLKLR
jgi:hypothetical protein